MIMVKILVLILLMYKLTSSGVVMVTNGNLILRLI